VVDGIRKQRVPLRNLVTEAVLSTGVHVVDEVDVDVYGSAWWEATFRRDDGERISFTLHAVHNGTASSDATDAQDDVVGGAATSGAVDEVSVSVDLDGSGASQKMRLKATIDAGNWSVDVHRGPLVGSGQ